MTTPIGAPLELADVLEASSASVSHISRIDRRQFAELFSLMCRAIHRSLVSSKPTRIPQFATFRVDPCRLRCGALVPTSTSTTPLAQLCSETRDPEKKAKDGKGRIRRIRGGCLKSTASRRQSYRVSFVLSKAFAAQYAALPSVQQDCGGTRGIVVVSRRVAAKRSFGSKDSDSRASQRRKDSSIPELRMYRISRSMSVYKSLAQEMLNIIIRTIGTFIRNKRRLRLRFCNIGEFRCQNRVYSFVFSSRFQKPLRIPPPSQRPPKTNKKPRPFSTIPSTRRWNVAEGVGSIDSLPLDQIGGSVTTLPYLVDAGGRAARRPALLDEVDVGSGEDLSVQKQSSSISSSCTNSATNSPVGVSRWRRRRRKLRIRRKAPRVIDTARDPGFASVYQQAVNRYQFELEKREAEAEKISKFAAEVHREETESLERELARAARNRMSKSRRDAASRLRTRKKKEHKHKHKTKTKTKTKTVLVSPLRVRQSDFHHPTTIPIIDVAWQSVSAQEAKKARQEVLKEGLMQQINEKKRRMRAEVAMDRALEQEALRLLMEQDVAESQTLELRRLRTRELAREWDAQIELRSKRAGLFL